MAFPPVSGRGDSSETGIAKTDLEENKMKLNRFTISGLVLFLAGASKLLLWDNLFNNKSWFMAFSHWYWKAMIVLTLVFFGICLVELAKTLFQKR